MMAELEADRDALYVRQRACGWRQAVEQEDTAWRAVLDARRDIVDVLPSTAADARMLIEFVRAAVVLDWRVSGETPYGIPDHFVTKILSHALAMVGSAGPRRLAKAA